jgi:pyruvate dehydrogenase E1 component
VDARFVALATLSELAQDGKLDRKVVAQAIKDLGIDAEKLNPAKS